MTNFKCVIAYDGRRYKGWRKSKKNADQTIQGKLEAILQKRFDMDIEVISAVSTEAGVNASHQVIHFKTPDDNIDAVELQKYFETYLPDDIIMLSIEKADDRFHSRYNVASITYEYRLWKQDAPHRPLFERQYVYKLDKPLNVDAMRVGAKKFIGEHDFTGFSTKGKRNSPTKHVYDVAIQETDFEIIISIEAKGFLLNMERIMVGTLVQIGLGQRDTYSINRVFKSKNRDDAGHKIMAHALCLKDVKY